MAELRTLWWSQFRLGCGSGEVVTILYFGDFDPSGEDMVRALVERLADFDCWPKMIKAALTRDDIKRYDLPPDFTKTTDSWRAAFVAKHGGISVKLDVLSIDALKARIVDEVEARVNLDVLAEVQATEQTEREALVSWSRQLNGARR